MTNSAITAAAQAVAEAEDRAARTAATLQAARDRLALVDSRIADLDAARSDMISRRQHGEAREDDAAMLALNTADREGLVAIREEAAAAEAEAREAHDAETRLLDTARWRLGRAEAEAKEKALVEHADALGALILRNIAELNEVGRKLDRGRPAWVPSYALRDALRTLAIQSGTS